MSDTILSKTEMRELTQREKFSAQRRVLLQIHLPFRELPNGRPIVARKTFETWAGVDHSNTGSKAENVELNLGGI